MKNIILTLVLLSLTKLVIAAETFNGNSNKESFKVEQVANGLGVVWGMDFINADNIIFTQRDGHIGLLNLKTGGTKTVNNSPKVMAQGQGGLLDVKLYNDFVYFTYVKNQNKKGVTTLARAKLEGNSLINWKDLLITKSATKTSRHFGSRITFDDSSHLFFSVGDRGVRPNGQDLSTHAGSILRLNLDGSVPKDNPFVNEKGALPEIWSFGHRNPQGIFYDKTRKKLFSIEHGPRGGDEINLIEKGLNYGWAVVSKGKEYISPFYVGKSRSKQGMQDAIKVFTPSIAPASLIVYSGKAFKNWKGDLFSGALKLAHINQVKLDNNLKPIAETRLFEDLGQRIRALVESEQGFIYFSTDNGSIYRMKPLKNK